MRRVLALMLTLQLLVTTVTAGGGDKQRAKADKHFATAEKARSKGDFDKAETEYTAALSLEAQHAEALYGLGQLQMATKRYDEALATLIRCREAFADTAIRDWKEAEARREDDVRATRARLTSMYRGTMKGGGSANNEIDLLQEQLIALEKPLARPAEGETPAGVSMAIGSAYFRLGRMEDAESEFLAAITIDPDLGQAHNNLAALYMMSGRVAQAASAVAAAEQAGFDVHPQLKKDISAARANASK